jgi:hypothetical protein
MTKFKEKEFEVANTNFIGSWYMRNPSICDDLITYFNEHPHLHRKGLTSNSKGVVTNEKIKKSTDLTMDESTKSIALTKYLKELQAITSKYVERFDALNFSSSFGLQEAINIQYYKPGEAYFGYHCERSPKYPNVSRHLAWMTYLNTVTDQGGTEFYHQKLTVSPEKGLTLIWPADWTYLHRGIASPTQDKYIITGWFNIG